MRLVVIRLWFRLSKPANLRQRAEAFVRGAIVVGAFGESGQRGVVEVKVFIRGRISSVLVSVRKSWGRLIVRLGTGGLLPQMTDWNRDISTWTTFVRKSFNLDVVQTKLLIIERWNRVFLIWIIEGWFSRLGRDGLLMILKSLLTYFKGDFPADLQVFQDILIYFCLL